MASNIHTAKNTLRQEVKASLALMSIEKKMLQSNYVADKVIQHHKYLVAKRIGIYLSLPDEVQTDSILKHMFSIGKTCFIPRYSSENMEMVEMQSFEERHTLPKTKWNIPQPSGQHGREEAMKAGGLDVIIIPGRAFTKSGYRLGRGKGYYDKYLRQYRENFGGALPYMIGIAFKEQIVDEVPVDETDVQLNEVIFDNRKEN